MFHSRPDYNRIQDPAGLIPADEPVFLLRAQDAFAYRAVKYWCAMAAEYGCTPEMISAAQDQADRMKNWPQKKVPDLPPPTGDRSGGQGYAGVSEDEYPAS